MLRNILPISSLVFGLLGVCRKTTVFSQCDLRAVPFSSVQVKACMISDFSRGFSLRRLQAGKYGTNAPRIRHILTAGPHSVRMHPLSLFPTAADLFCRFVRRVRAVVAVAFAFRNAAGRAGDAIATWRDGGATAPSRT